MSALLFVFLASFTSVLAENVVSVVGQVRFREEFDQLTSVFDTNDVRIQETGFLRTRIGIEAVINENATAVIQLQDSRIIGGLSTAGDQTSTTLINGANIDLHQAFIRVKDFFGKGWGIQLGRFELNLGNERIFGAVGWDNVGRSMEGGIISFENSDIKVSLFDIKALEQQNRFENDDFDIIGLNVNVKGEGLSAFGVLDYFAEKGELVNNIGSASGIESNKLERFSFGSHLKRTEGTIDFEANVVYQTGRQLMLAPAPNPLSLYFEQDISAFLIAAELGYSFEYESNPRVAIGVDYASGDENPADVDFKAFNNLYYTGHKFRGYMDYFVPSNAEGLVDLALRAKINPTNGWTLKTDAHLFSFAQSYLDFRGEDTKDVGLEIDVTLSTSRIAGVNVSNGFSMFFASESFAGRVDPDIGLWGYSMVTLNF